MLLYRPRSRFAEILVLRSKITHLNILPRLCLLPACMSRKGSFLWGYGSVDLLQVEDWIFFIMCLLHVCFFFFFFFSLLDRFPIVVCGKTLKKKVGWAAGDASLGVEGRGNDFPLICSQPDVGEWWLWWPQVAEFSGGSFPEERKTRLVRGLQQTGIRELVMGLIDVI